MARITIDDKIEHIISLEYTKHMSEKDVKGRDDETRRDETLSLEIRDAVTTRYLPHATVTTADARTIYADRKTPSDRSRGVGHGHDRFACSCKKGESDNGVIMYSSGGSQELFIQGLPPKLDHPQGRGPSSWV